MKQFAVRCVVVTLVVSMAGFVEAAGRTTTTVTTIKGTIAGLPGTPTAGATGLAAYTRTVVKNKFGVTISHSWVMSCSIKAVQLPDGGAVEFDDATMDETLGKGTLMFGSASSILTIVTSPTKINMPMQNDEIDVSYNGNLIAEGVFGPPVTTKR